MEQHNDKPSETNFSNQRSAIPFGKFESGAEDTFPCNESMIGREGARAKLIDFLTNAGIRKAILVTGRRGMGKSSFVQYCLREYEESSVERYWRSDSGKNIRSLLWLIIISVPCALAFVVGSRILQILQHNIAESTNNILWIPALLLTLCLSYPMVFAGKIFATVFQPFLNKTSNLIGFLVVFIVAFILVFWSKGFGSPVVTLSRLLVALAAIYYAGELIDIFPSLKISIGKKRKVLRISGPLILGFGIVCYILTYYLQPIVIYVDKIDQIEIPGTSVFFSNLIIAMLLCFFALLNRYFSLYIRPENIRELQIDRTLTKAMWCYLGVAILLFFLWMSLDLFLSLNDTPLTIHLNPKNNFSLYEIILYVIFIYKTRLTIKYQNNGERKNRSTYPISILSIKAIFLIILSLYALHPILSKIKLTIGSCCNWQLISENKDNEKQGEELPKKPALSFHVNHQKLILLTKERPYCNAQDKFHKSLYTDELDSHLKWGQDYLSLFLGIKSELTYVTIVIVIIALFFWIEYEWIIRPDQFARRDKAMYTGNRPSYYDDCQFEEYKLEAVEEEQDDKKRKHARNELQEYIQHQANIRERYRAFEQLTFLRYFCQLQHSTIISTVNLGFEELDHRSVIYGMLLGIRSQYYDNFVSLRSSRVLIRTFFSILFAMIIVTNISDALFVVPSKELPEIPNEKKSLIEKNKEERKIAIRDMLIKEGKAEIDVDAQAESIIRYCGMEKNWGAYLDKTNQESQMNSITENRIKVPKVPKLLCELGGFYAGKILPIIYFELIHIKLNKNDIPEGDILHTLFHLHIPYYEYEFNKNKKPDRMSLCVFHLILFVYIFYLFRRFNRLFAFVPYPLILEKIDELLNDLTATTTTKKNRNPSKIAQIMGSTFSGDYHENEKNIEKGNTDPRFVELSFMSILEEISHSRSVYFQPLHSKNNSPAIEITFVFDELDKLATDINSLRVRGDQNGNDSELYRLNLMKGLLSNMKRVITASAARYIFLGGRLLHDDWLADGARRQPLLTSIFSDEIYLPSLLTDTSIDWFNNTNSTLDIQPPNPSGSAAFLCPQFFQNHKKDLTCPLSCAAAPRQPWLYGKTVEGRPMKRFFFASGRCSCHFLIIPAKLYLIGSRRYCLPFQFARAQPLSSCYAPA